MKKSDRIHQMIGIDLATEMLCIGTKKLQTKPYARCVTLKGALVLSIPFIEDSFDCVTLSFGIRNVTDVPTCLKEIHRVLNSTRRILILEFSLSPHSTLKNLHLYYLRHIMPKIGAFISKDHYAYAYLNKTIEMFPYSPLFCQLLVDTGFKNFKAHPLTFGVVTLYQRDKS